MNDIIIKAEEKMKNTIINLETRLLSIRVGRATTNLVDGVMVNCYGSMMSLPSIATVVVADAHQLKVTPYDKSSLGAIEKGIFEANLGLTPNNNGEAIFINIPPLTTERRIEFTKSAKAITEEGKVAIRNIRQEANTLVKNSTEADDVKKGLEKDIQDLTNKYTTIIDTKLKEKETELMSV